MRQKNKKTILWAFDPSQKPQDLKKDLKEIEKWAIFANMRIQPVTIISTSLSQLSTNLVPKTLERYREFSNRMIRSAFGKIRSSEIEEPKILFSKSFSNGQLAQELAEYAKTSQASMIFATTRRHSLLVMGSMGRFADSLVSHSTVPVLLMNPKARLRLPLQTVVYPSDLSRISESTFLQMSPLFKGTDTNICIFNQIEQPWYQSAMYPGMPAIDLSEIAREIEHNRKTLAAEMSRSLRLEKLQAEMIIQDQQGSLAHDIVQFSNKRRANLVVLNRGESKLTVGPTIRHTATTAQCPVLVLPQVLLSPEETKETAPPQRTPRKSKPRLESVLGEQGDRGLQEITGGGA